MSFSFPHKKRFLQGFTLLETLGSITILALVISGPLAVIIESSSYARQTKDTIVATYLAEEMLELLQNEYDTLYVLCTKNPGESFCTPSGDETSGQVAWRKFKERFSAYDSQPSCFLSIDGVSSNPDGCSYDYLHMIHAPTTTPVRYISTASACRFLEERGITVLDAVDGNAIEDIVHRYVCRGEPSHRTGTLFTSSYTRKLNMEMISSFETDPQLSQYHDDVRVTATVSYRGVNGLTKNVSVVRFMHSQP